MVRLNYTVKMNALNTESAKGQTDVAGLNKVIKANDLGAYVSHIKHEIGNGDYVDVEVFANGVVVYTVAK